MEFCKNIFEVILYGVFRDIQSGPDFFVSESRGQQLEYLFLPFREVGRSGRLGIFRRPCGELFQNSRGGPLRERRCTAKHAFQQLAQLLQLHFFGKIAVGSALDRFKQVPIFLGDR